MKKIFTFLTAVWAILGVAFSAQANEKLTLLLDWFVNPDHANIIIAQQKGFFAQQGLDVEIIEPTDPSMPPKLVAAGQGDLAVNYQPQLVMQVEQGLPLVRVGTIIGTPLNSLTVLESSQIKSLADLKGKKIGFSVSGFEDSLLERMLSTVGLTRNDVELVNVNWALSQSLLSKQVDAVIGAFRNFELHELNLEGHQGRLFYPEQYGVPSYEELIFVAQAGKQNDVNINKFLTAIEQATAYIKQNPDQAWQDFVNYKPQELNNELNRRAWQDTIPLLTDNTRQLNQELYQQVAQFMLDSKLIKAVPVLENYAVEPAR
ncbi:thiamine biosynthesis protein [Lonepinella koalarum]|uniref:Putative hydroxymethylpyrimidine transport system substrate-binding protein n=1 Tax=Lonepinella koalarum TaxID=53417 RepID=A0A4R1L2T1_9PAST|nr:ABC transporter substrate-binding protein [Lonepinella koalarum]MDH2926139.1 thiamine biosynthesis protein [Lonepinella koalarum]TCK71290.1 putative hydroxymethylpyrimidine transport system substrate-binding protein [Lonepinella koalarum]TFJ91009.1 thiamine biosynthesis protein [Lonepinella koalarum]TYG34827.1 thiamine biosynthesis protein [Lonepinella koalarum]